MEFRLAVMEDLPAVQEMYQGIIREMEANGIAIWDEIYPCAFFEDDISGKRLYLLLEGGEIVSAFALCGRNGGEDAAAWADCRSEALYLDRLGVRAGRTGRGVGSLALARARETAGALGAAYLRLFVVDCNVPAAHLYEKNGFTRVNGVYDEVIDEGYVLHEFPYEIKL